MIRCKVRVQRVTQEKNTNGQTDSETVVLAAVSADSPENKQWSKWTPNAQFTLTISNPEAFGKLSKGHEFFVDFTSVAAETEAKQA